MSPASPAYLEMEIDGESHRITIPGESALRIGRSETVGIVLDDHSVSRHHAFLQRAEDNHYYITDLGSSNGTYVNQKRVSAPVPLQPGDRISIGNYTLTFCYEAENPLAPPTGKSKATYHLFSPKLITVLVADIRDFTPLSRHVPAHTLAVITGTLFGRAGRALHERGAWEQKYIGDAVMAIWLHGSLEPRARDLWGIFDAVSQLVEIAASLQGALGLDAPIRMGFGINSGWASVGNVGSIVCSDYTALGEVVNKAFRLESATRAIPCDMAVGQETYDFLSGLIDAGRIFTPSSVKLKGYDELSTAYTAPLTLLPTLLESFC